MKTLVSVIAIAAFLATTGAVRVYSKDAVDSLSTYMLLEWTTKHAELINPNTELEFEKSKEPEDDDDIFTFNVISKPNPASEKEDEVCGNNLGINVNHGERYICNLTSLSVNIDEDIYYSTPSSIKFILNFNSAKQKPASLHVPLLKIPLPWVSEDQKIFEEWAHNEQVGIHSPLNETSLWNIAKTKPFSINFDWLKELLQYGIRKSGYSKYLPGSGEVNQVFYGRPIILTNEKIKEIFSSIVG